MIGICENHPFFGCYFCGNMNPKAIAKMEALLQSQKAEADETKSTSEKSRPPTGSVKSGKSAKSTSSRQ